MNKTAIAEAARVTLALVLAVIARGVFAATPVDAINVNLDPLIDQSAVYPTRFAVDVPHAVSLGSAGSWTQIGPTRTWTYSVQIATAVSMSFHASRVALPASAVLTVTGASGKGATYRARDIARSGLWTRPTPGDSLVLSLSVGAAEAPQVSLQIDSFQAGYRGLGGGVPDHPHYRELRAQAVQQLSACSVNYECAATSSNQGPANATVAILIGNVGQCTGTLLNDTSGDVTPYVLTARHCESGAMGGGDPGAAANVTIYWDAVSPCGVPLGSIYDGNAITQVGATTMVEQQDAWLIRLDAPPAASDAYYSGWDATGGTFSGGYAIHHSLGYDKQYVEWFGQAILQTIPGSVLGLNYTSNFWGVVNVDGNVGSGASGGALVDPNNHAVGSLTYGITQDGEDSPGVCPVASPPAPAPSTVVAQYTALSSIWSSTDDTTSTTGPATLQSVLDAAATGQLVLNGIGLLPVTFSVNQTSPFTGQLVTLTWSAPGAQACTATGGVSGDGWAGAQPTSGSFQLTEQAGNQVTYSIRCTASGTAGAGSAIVTWQFVPASVDLTGIGSLQPNAGTMVQLQWAANTAPCTASGGTSGDGWAGSKASSGTQSVLVSVLGNVTYSLTCGTGARVATGQYTVDVVPPYVSAITSDANDLRVGQPVNINFGAGGVCTQTGGASGDGWAGPLSASSETVTETTPGTYTYTVTCTGAGATANLSSSNSISLTFTNAPATATLTPNQTQVEISSDPGAGASVLKLSWTSNVRPCAITFVGPGIPQGTVNIPLNPVPPTGSALDGEGVAGSYDYTVTCGAAPNQAQASATVNWFTNDPMVFLGVNNPFPLATPDGINWQSNLYPCTATGGESGDGWAGARAASGSLGLTESSLGAVTFGISCGSGAQTAAAQASTTVITPTATITANPSSVQIDSSLTLSWIANFAPCTLSSSPGGVFGQLLNATGQMNTSLAADGTYTFTIACLGAQASTQVSVSGNATTLAASASNVPVGTYVTLTWNSKNGDSCQGTGGTPGDGWNYSDHPISGSAVVTSSAAATVTYGITCSTGGQDPSQAQTQVTYTAAAPAEPALPTPSVTLDSTPSSQVTGSSVTLSWNSSNASACTASGGGNGDGWSGSLALSGTMSITEATAGAYEYDIACTGAPPAATAHADVEFTEPTVTVSAGSTGKSGGGALDPWSLTMLFLLLSGRYRRELLSKGLTRHFRGQQAS